MSLIKKLRVTVDGRAYDVTVELPEETGAPPQPVAPVSRPVAPASVAHAPAPTPPVAPSAPTPASAGPAGPGDVPSPLAGRVSAVVVTVGQEVKEGEHLLTLEAMKMNTFVFAPQAGKVAEINSAVGDAVEEGQTLMRLQ